MPRALGEALDASQRASAILDSTASADIITMAKLAIEPLSPAGIPASSLTSAQRALLMKLVDVYTGTMAADIASERRARIEKAGWDSARTSCASM
jgi:hypothetical protein